MQCHPEKKLAFSQAKTSGEVYASGGSIRLSPKGASDLANAAGSTGAELTLAGDFIVGMTKA